MARGRQREPWRDKRGDAMEGWSGKRSSVLDQLWTWGGNEEEEEDVDEVPGQEEGEDDLDGDHRDFKKGDLGLRHPSLHKLQAGHCLHCSIANAENGKSFNLLQVGSITREWEGRRSRQESEGCAGSSKAPWTINILVLTKNPDDIVEGNHLGDNTCMFPLDQGMALPLHHFHFLQCFSRAWKLLKIQKLNPTEVMEDPPMRVVVTRKTTPQKRRNWPDSFLWFCVCV